jgi:hypothetical protein
LKNRAVFTEFASFLNTAVEIVEEVTSRNCTNAQDVDFVKCYGIRATRKQEQEKQEQANDGSCLGDYYSGGCSWDGSSGYDGNTVNNNHYDYYENADNVGVDNVEMDMDEEMTSVSQMLADFEAMRALTAAAAPVAEDTKVEVEVEVEQQVVVIANESEEAELVMTAAATAVKEEQEKEKETTNNSSSNGENDAKPKGKWFSWF